jgi:TPP-dependent pyruvate/acetoin dehydrogenase alpha subunit
MGRCPIRKLEQLLLENNIMSKQERDEIHKTVSEEVEESVKFARASPFPDAKDLLRDVFKQV